MDVMTQMLRSALLLAALLFLPAISSAQQKTIPLSLADGFDFPVGKPDAKGYYISRGLRLRSPAHYGEDWNGLMHDAMVSPSSGRCSVEAGDCGSWLAVPFFVSFVLFSTHLVLKMIVALVLENYVNALQRDESSLRPAHAHTEAQSLIRCLTAAQGPDRHRPVSGITTKEPT